MKLRLMGFYITTVIHRMVSMVSGMMRKQEWLALSLAIVMATLVFLLVHLIIGWSLEWQWDAV